MMSLEEGLIVIVFFPLEFNKHPSAISFWVHIKYTMLLQSGFPYPQKQSQYFYTPH
jgi:hypothetical protein